MFLDLEQLGPVSSNECDVCIVGSGPAGLSVLSELIQWNGRVVILESGGIDVQSDIQTLNESENTGPRYLNLTASRLRVFGGAGKIWAGVCRPFAASEFCPSTVSPLMKWPIEYSDLDEFYRRAANILQLRFESFFDQSWLNDSRNGQVFPSLSKDLVTKESDGTRKFLNTRNTAFLSLFVLGETGQTIY